MKSSKALFVIASFFGLTGVALGAFGAHALKSAIMADMLSVFETGVRYQMYHAFAVFLATWAFKSSQNREFQISAWLFCAGVILFSGSLYLYVMTTSVWFAYLTPLGGLLFLGGWCALAYGFWKEKNL